MGASSPVVVVAEDVIRAMHCLESLARERERDARTSESFPELASDEVGDELALDADDLLLPRLQHRQGSFGEDVEVGIDEVGVDRQAVVPAQDYMEDMIQR
jgi:hypothetical protein